MYCSTSTSYLYYSTRFLLVYRISSLMRPLNIKYSGFSGFRSDSARASFVFRFIAGLEAGPRECANIPPVTFVISLMLSSCILNLLLVFFALTNMTDALANSKPLEEASDLLSPWLKRVSVTIPLQSFYLECSPVLYICIRIQIYSGVPIRLVFTNKLSMNHCSSMAVPQSSPTMMVTRLVQIQSESLSLSAERQ
jgi:hypothetical protein